MSTAKQHFAVKQHPIVDQRTDRSGAAFVKIAKRLDDQDLAEAAMNTLFSMERPEPLDKTASFPTDTPEDTILSRIYFEGQREKIAADLAGKLEAGVFEPLEAPESADAFKMNMPEYTRDLILGRLK